MKTKAITRFLSTIFLLAFLIGCSGGGGGSDNEAETSQASETPEGTETKQVKQPIEVKGAAVDGYLTKSVVCLDLNGNNYCDLATEPATTTDELGQYTLDLTNYQDDPNFEKATILVFDGYDSDTGKRFTGKLFSTKDTSTATTADGKKSISVNVTAITTLVAKIVQSGETLDNAKKQVKKALNIPDNIDVSADPIQLLKNNEQGAADFISKNVALNRSIETLVAAATQDSNLASNESQVADKVFNALAAAIKSQQAATDTKTVEALVTKMAIDTQAKQHLGSTVLEKATAVAAITAKKTSEIYTKTTVTTLAQAQTAAVNATKIAAAISTLVKVDTTQPTQNAVIKLDASFNKTVATDQAETEATNVKLIDLNELAIEFLTLANVVLTDLEKTSLSELNGLANQAPFSLKGLKDFISASADYSNSPALKSIVNKITAVIQIIDDNKIGITLSGRDVLTRLVKTNVSQINQNCPINGGVQLDVGIDTNVNGLLDDNEVDSTRTQYICHGANGASIVGAAVNQAGELELTLSDNSVINAGSYKATLIDTNPLTKTSTIRGTVPHSTRVAPKSLTTNTTPARQINTRAVREIAPKANTRAITSKKGSLWLTPNAIASAIKSDIQAKKVVTVPPPIVKAREIPIQADGSYEIKDVPSGTDYSLTYVNDQNEGVKVDNLSLSPGQTLVQNIKSTELKPTGGLTLTIQSLRTGNVIQGATVRLHNLNQTDISDATGQVQIADLAEGTYAITIEAAGYVSKYQTVQVQSGQTITIPAIELNDKKGSLSGDVTVLGLSDYSNVIVYAQSQDGSIYTSLTNSTGSYRFNSLPIGSGYSVIASAHDYKTAKSDGITIEENLTQVAPSMTLERSHAAHGTLEGYARFAGRADMTHAGIIVSIEGTSYEAITARDGSFVVNNLPAGAYTLNFTDSNYKAQTNQIEIVSGAATRLDDIELIANAGTVKGLVQDEVGSPITNALIQLQTPSKTHTAFTDANGLYELSGVLTGSLTVQASKDGYSASETVSKLDTANQVLDLTSTPIVLTRLTLTGQIQLSGMTDHSGVSVLLTGTDIPTTVTDQSGAFTLYGVKPGQYIIQLNRPGYNTISQIVDVKSAPYSLPDIITLTPKVGSISGKLILPLGFGHTQNIEASLIDTSGTQLAQSTVLTDGSYLLTNISPGDGYIVRIKGTDALGNVINIENQTNLSVSANSIITAKDINVTLTDPNPPVIQSVSLAQALNKNALGQYTINPSIYTQLSNGDSALTTPSYVDLSVVAQDADGDPITYQFDTDLGKFVNVTSSQARWMAPENGGLATISITAKSNNRTTTQTVEIAVNHYADILFLSPKQFAFPDLESPNVNSLQLNQFSVRVDDFEDGVIPDSNINWYSSLSGLIGTGSTISSTLKPGKHEISLEATDSQGLIANSDKQSYVVEIPNQILLKVPQITSTLNGQPISSTHDLNINANNLTLQYTSSLPSVASVNATGQIVAVASGTTLIKVESIETDTNNTPLYSTQMVVRVLDQVLDNKVQSTLGINELKEIHVTPTSIANPLRIDNLPIGHYVLVLFDKQDIVANSNVTSVVKTGGVNVSNVSANNASKQIIHRFQVSIPGTSVELHIAPGSVVTSDALIKVALYPGVDLQDVNGYLNVAHWDQHNEPNDSMYIAKPIVLEEEVTSYLSESELYDVYSFDTIAGKTYSISIKNNAASFSMMLYSIGDYADSQKYAAGWGVSLGHSADIEFTATTTGKAVIHLQGKNVYKGHQYSVVALPSTIDGLKHDKLTYEPNNTVATAAPIKLQTTVTSKLTKDETFDYYSFDVVAGQTYALDLRNEFTSATSLCYTIGSEAVVDEVMKVSCIGIGTVSNSPFTATTTGNVLIGVHANGYYQNMDYQLTALPASGNGLVQDPINYEPNNTAITAAPVNLQNQIKSKLTSDEKFDYYSFDVVAGQTYALDLRNEFTSATSLCYTVGSEAVVDEVMKVSCINIGAVNNRSFTAATTGKAIVGVHAYNYYKNVDYQITTLPSSVNGLVQDSQTFEPNNTPVTAYPIGLEQTVVSKLAVDELVDNFSFDAVAGKTYSIDISNESNSYSSLAYTVGSVATPNDLVTQTYIGTGKTNSLTITPATSGVVVIRLYGYIDYQNYDYQLTVMPTTADGLVQDPQTFEPNNTSVTAYPITLEQTVASKLSSDESEDNFSFEAVAGKTYSIDISNESNSYSSLAYTVGSVATPNDLVTQTYIGTGKTNSLTITPATSGVVVIRLYGYIDYQNYDYQLTVMPTTADGLVQDPQTFEPNNTSVTATPLTLEQTVVSKLAVDEYQDYFSFDAVAGKTYSIDISNQNNSYSSLAYTVGSVATPNDLVTQTYIGTGKANSLTITPTTSGVVVIRLYGHIGYQNYDYQFTVAPIP